MAARPADGSLVFQDHSIGYPAGSWVLLGPEEVMEQLIWRPLREIERELAVEYDPHRILELCNELIAAVTAQRSVPDGGREQGRPLPDRAEAA